MHYFGDLYGHDNRVAAALAAGRCRWKPTSIETGVRRKVEGTPPAAALQADQATTSSPGCSATERCRGAWPMPAQSAAERRMQRRHSCWRCRWRVAAARSCPAVTVQRPRRCACWRPARRRAPSGQLRAGVRGRDRAQARCRLRHRRRAARPRAGRRDGRRRDPERSRHGGAGEGRQDRCQAHRSTSAASRWRWPCARARPVPDVLLARGAEAGPAGGKSIAHADPARGATAGAHFARVLEQLGIAGECAAR